MNSFLSNLFSFISGALVDKQKKDLNSYEFSPLKGLIVTILVANLVVSTIAIKRLIQYNEYLLKHHPEVLIELKKNLKKDLLSKAKVEKNRTEEIKEAKEKEKPEP